MIFQLPLKIFHFANQFQVLQSWGHIKCDSVWRHLGNHWLSRLWQCLHDLLSQWVTRRLVACTCWIYYSWALLWNFWFARYWCFLFQHRISKYEPSCHLNLSPNGNRPGSSAPTIHQQYCGVMTLDLRREEGNGLQGTFYSHLTSSRTSRHWSGHPLSLALDV